MLSKDPALRPPDALAVARELAAIPDVGGGVPDVVARRAVGLSGGEQRPLSVMLAYVPGEEALVRGVVERHGGVLARLANGGLLVTLAGRGGTHEQVATASACALALREAFPGARIGLSTGWGATGVVAPGHLIDQAASLLAGSMAPGVRVDGVTASLLGARFDLQPDRNAVLLLGRSLDDGPRRPRSRTTPYVGHDNELALVAGTLRACGVDSAARAVVVTGPAGQGKSRLLSELLARTEPSEGELRVLCARGDPIAPGSSLMVARSLVRQAARLPEGVPEMAQRERLTAHVAELGDAPGDASVVDFLAELLGLSPGDGVPTDRFRAARNDERVMAEGLQWAFGAWVAALCAAAPLLVVVDDAQWGDEASLTYLAGALRTLRARPLMVLVLGRPELASIFPSLWDGIDRVTFNLPRLPRRAAENLVRAALGPAAQEASVTRIVERAEGNALYLEELARHVAEGDPAGPLPDTVLALAHSRLERLEPDARRVVRAASVFGDVFWQGGLASLLGVAAGDTELARWVDRLVDGEIFERSRASRFANETELAFRASLLREAAYATLVHDDRAKGHLLAGRWLESVGERDALRLGEHFDRSGDRQGALTWLPRAASTALKGGDFQAAVRLCGRAAALGPEGPDRGKLLQTEGLALAMRGDLPGSAQCLRAAIGCFETGTPRWFACVSALLLTGTFLGDPAITSPLLSAVVDPSMKAEPSGPYGVSIYAAGVGLGMVGLLEAAEGLVVRAEALVADPGAADPVFVVAIELTRAALSLARGRIGAAALSLTKARALTARTGDPGGQLLVTVHESAVFAEAGDEDRCRAAVEELAKLAGRLGAPSFADWGALSLAQVRLGRGLGEEVVPTLSDLLGRLDPMFVAFARAMLSQACVAAGDLDAAERAARRTLEDASMFPGACAAALGTLARVLLRRGDVHEAIAHAERGIEAASRVGSPRDLSILYLAWAEALDAAGRREEATGALERARDRVRGIAASIDDAALRESYLTRVEANALTLARAAER
jgi:tetratricopeptide (TPR) repeat protein